MIQTSLLPIPAYALKIALEESADPPKGIEVPSDDELNKDVGAETAAPASPQTGTTPTPAGGQTTQPPAGGAQTAPAPAPEKPYRGIYRLWKPLRKIFPLKNANVTFSVANLLNDRQWAVYDSHYNALGNYFIEGGKSLGFFKDLNAQFQYNRQLKNGVRSNAMKDISATVFDVQVKYTDKTSRAFQGGASPSMNVQQVRKTQMTYPLNEKVKFDYTMDENENRTVAAAPSRTVNRKNTYSATWAIRDRVNLIVSSSLTTNRNYVGDATTKLQQTEARITLPISARLGVELAYQFQGNRNLQPGAPETETRKTARIVNFNYRLSDDLTVAYQFTAASDRSMTSSLHSNFDTTNRDFKLSYVILPWLRFQGENSVSFSQNTGKSAVRQGTFNVDHSKIKWFPGNTSVQLRKNLSRSGEPTNPGSSETYTMSVSTPLSYFNGDLSLSHQYTLNQQANFSAADLSEQFTDSVTNRYDASYKFTPSLSVGSSLNVAENRASTLTGITSQSANRTFSDRVSLNIKNPLTHKIGPVPSMVYTITQTRNANQATLPSNSKTETRVIKNAGTFTLQGGQMWNGNYTLEKSMSKTVGAGPLRALQHRVTLNFTDLFGFQCNTNYTLTKQSNGGVSSGMFRATRRYDEKTLISLTYEFFKNQDSDQRVNNNMNRIFELMMETTF